MAKRANGEGTLRKRKDGRWEARYVNPFDDKQHSIYGKTQKEVKEKLLKIQHEIAEGSFLDETNITVSDWLGKWVSNYTGDVKPLTIASYKRAIKNHLKPKIGEILLKALKTDDIQKLYIEMAKSGLSPKTIKNTHGVLHKALGQAVKLRYIKRNVSDECITPRAVRKEIEVMEDKNVVDFLQAIKTDEYGCIYYVTLFTGMRQGEVLGLTWDCIDFDNNMIYINKQLIKSRNGSGEFYFGSLKNNKTRTIVASQNVMDALLLRKKKQEREKENAGNKWVDDTSPWSNLVFTTDTGNHLSHNTVYKHYKKIVKEIGIEASRFHDLRHSFAVISLQNGDDIKTVQESLGHYTSAFTLQTYAHATKKMRKDSANRMDEFIKRVSGI